MIVPPSIVTRTRLLLLLTLTAGALVLTACGSGAGGSDTGTAAGSSVSGRGYATALRFAACMRSHGVPQFPDPSAAGGIAIPRGAPGVNVNPHAPAFQSAARACRRLLPHGGTPGPIPAAARRRLLQFSQCMRTHGVPKFPDPVFPASGGAVIQAPGGPAGSSGPSPAFRRAAQACGQPLAKGG